MICHCSVARTRLAIDSRINRDIVANAREQGFTFSDPNKDFTIWNTIVEADLENPAYMCSAEVAHWLMGKAIEATLFQLYLANRSTLTNQ
ncbi:hypothetical protein FAES_pFAES01032 (plasmid) [Fibrella aestuarina BUZ 2]|uniref:Uncharacterized protein n=1 Tax=Fibrella aestuarina BUZ 2 TaxID=1166018 RepID=I0KHC3_9BACT|nr:hypothetical protein [Fibrella aestuarina]CCH03526.1 hypothetical protein FAES_pFAES01032 [Fibrella aestuarina BUZ 2]